jgi:hypothetical protein
MTIDKRLERLEQKLPDPGCLKCLDRRGWQPSASAAGALLLDCPSRGGDDCSRLARTAPAVGAMIGVTASPRLDGPSRGGDDW